MRVKINGDSRYNAITEGVIWQQILIFFFPILLGTFFQQLYNTADAVIVGRFLGKEALAAVGGGTSVAINLLIGFFVGLSSGATVVISQYYGAKYESGTRKAIHTSIALSIICGVLITIIGVLFTRPILVIMGTPDDVLPLATSYMRIFFMGSIANTIYNMGSGIFRAFGDSKKPLWFLIISCGVNIVLDLLFVGFFKMNVDGAAIATIISQIISAILVIFFLMRRKDNLRLSWKEVRIDLKILSNILKIGLPAGIQSALYTVSNIIIQVNINGYGTNAAAAWAAFGKLDTIFWMAINALGVAITTIVGQNFGAELYKRVRTTIRLSLLMGTALTLMISTLFYVAGKWGIMLFTSDQEVINLGVEILRFLAPVWITYMPIEILSGALRGCGKTFIPTIITVVGICVLRMIWLFALPYFSAEFMMVFACYPISWIIAALALAAYYFLGHAVPKEKLN